MRYISCKLDDLKKIVLPIGYEGENEHTRVQVDAGDVFKEYPAAVPTLKVHGPTGTIYPAEVTRDGKNVIWDIKASDCAADGSGEAQFTFTLNNVIVKSCIAKIKVYRSIVGGSTPPDPVQDWIDDAEEVLDDLAAMDNIAKTAEAGDVGKALSPKTVVDGVVTEWQYVEPGAGTEDYTDLENKPQIGGVTLSGDKSLHDLGIAAESAIPDVSGKANLSVVAPAFVQETANDAGSLVTYTDGVVYVLPEGHTAGTTWANTQKTATNIAEQQRLLLSGIHGVEGAVFGTDEIIGSKNIDNTASYIGVYQSKIDLDVLKGEKVTVSISGTAFTNESACTLYFYLGDGTESASQGAFEVGTSREFELTDDLKGVAIYAIPIVEGTVIISVTKKNGGLTEYVKSKNYYKGVAESGYWTGTSMTTSSSYGHTPPIKLLKGDYLFTSTEGLMGANGKTAIIVDSQGNPSSSITGTSVGTVSQTGIYSSRPILKFTLSADSYVSFNIGALTGSTTAIYTGNFMVVEGSTLADFPDYEEYFEPYIVLKTDLALTGKMINQVNGLSGLIGKTAIFDGDSICKGTINGTTPKETDGWAGFICPANGMKYKNFGVSGGVITSASNPAVSGKHSVVDNIDTMYSQYPNADFIIFEGGTNDADLIGSAISDPTVLGTYSETDYTGPFDATTFTGALETIFSKAISYWKGKAIGYIVAQKMGYGSGYYDDTHDNRRAYFTRAMLMCQKWGIPFINLWDGCYLNPTNPNCFDQTKTKDQNISGGYLYTDGQHLTEKGYKYISPMIEAWMKTL